MYSSRVNFDEIRFLASGKLYVSTDHLFAANEQTHA